MNRYMNGMGSYEAGAGQINQNISNYRSDVDNIKTMNKQLVQSAEQTVDLDALRSVGAEVGIRTLKGIAGKYGGKLYSAKMGERGSLEDFDKNLGKKATRFAKRKLGIAGDEEEVAESGEGIELGDLKGGEGTGGTTPSKSPGEGTDALDDDAGDAGDAVDESVGSFEDFMSNFKVPTLDNGDIDFDTINKNQAARSSGETKEREPYEEGENEDIPDDQLRTQGNMGDAADVADDVADDAGDAIGDAVGDAAKTAAKAAADGLADAGSSALGAGLETAGAALDATGVLAPVGLLVQGIGAVVEGGVIVKGVEDAWDWFKQDILGEKPNVKTTAIPKMLPSLAQKGRLIQPSYDSNMDMPSSVGGW